MKLNQTTFALILWKSETSNNTNRETMETMQQHRADRYLLLIALMIGLGALHSHAQYNSGSDGSYGPMNITSNTTLALPPNGIFNCTTITIASNAWLTFSNNTLNTPVYLLATGDIAINGVIDVSGATGDGIFGGTGGPGGFAGGNAASGGLPAGDGYGPGAGRAGTNNNSGGSAAYGTAPSGIRAGAIYGSPLLVPLVGGSGGGGDTGGAGGGGGGAILIASSTSIRITGIVLANGAPPYSGSGGGGGSGGAIRLVSPAFAGNGSLRAFSNGGGDGRIRVDCLDRRSLAYTYVRGPIVSFGSYMATFPANPPRLDVTQAAGNNIPVGTSSPVTFILPPNSSTNQTVTVQASNFGAPVPIRVVLTPDNGPGSSYDTQIDNSTANPAYVTVPVVVPVNVRVHVNAWTR